MINTATNSVIANMVANSAISQTGRSTQEAVKTAMKLKMIPSNPIEGLATIRSIYQDILAYLSLSGHETYFDPNKVKAHFMKVNKPEILHQALIDPLLPRTADNLHEVQYFPTYRTEAQRALLNASITHLERDATHTNALLRGPTAGPTEAEREALALQIEALMAERFEATEFETKRTQSRLWLKECQVANGKAMIRLQQYLTPDLIEHLNSKLKITKIQSQSEIRQGMCDLFDGQLTVEDVPTTNQNEENDIRTRLYDLLEIN